MRAFLLAGRNILEPSVSIEELLCFAEVVYCGTVIVLCTSTMVLIRILFENRVGLLSTCYVVC